MPAMSYPPRPCGICAGVFTPRLSTQYVCSADACQAERVARAKQRKAAERDYGEHACAVCGVVVSKRTAGQVTCLAAMCVKEHRRRSLLRFIQADHVGRWEAPIPTAEALVPADDTPRPVRLHDGTELEVVWAGDMVRHGERGGLLEPRRSLPSTVSDEAPGRVLMHQQDARSKAWSARRTRRKQAARKRQREVAA